MAVEDLNAVVITGQLTKPPTFDSSSWSYLEVAIRNRGSILYLVLHVPDRLRRTLYLIGPADKVLARGELAFVHSDKSPPGQVVLKVHALEPVTAHGRVGAAPGPSESHTNPGHAFVPTGDRRRRQRKRRGAPEGRRSA